MILPLSLLLASGLGVVLGAPAPNPPPQEAFACVNDKCFRAFANSRRPARLARASAYCSAYLNTVVSPVTVTGTPPVTQTLTARVGDGSFVTDQPATYTVRVTPDPITVTAVGSTYTQSLGVPDVTQTKEAIIREATEYGKATSGKRVS